VLAFLVQTLFALQCTTKRNGSYSSHLLGAHLPSPPFILRKAQQRNTLFALPRLQSEELNQVETLDWLQARLVLNKEYVIELTKRFPKAYTLSIEEQLKPTLDWLQERLGFNDEKLRELVRRQPTILNLSVQEQLEPNILWLQDRLALDQKSLQRVLLRLTPMVGGLAQLLGSKMEENTCLASRETTS
jgi:hypothetical protein